MRDKPRRRRAVSLAALTLLRPFFRYSTARDAFVLRIASGRFGPVLVDKTKPAPAKTPPTAKQRAGRFVRRAEPERTEPPVTQTRQR